MQAIIEVIEKALRKQGLSARRASLEAVGSPYLIREMRRGHAPSAEKMQALCRVLDLEFYIGPPRSQPDTSMEADSAQTDWQEAATALNRALVGAAEAADTVALMTGTGRPVPVRELQSAAGGGVMDLDETETGQVYFRTQWLKKHGLNPDRCCVIGVTGESMEPTLVDGCSILLDHDRRQLRAGGIFVVRTGDGLVVKRAGRDRDGGWQLCSDNPDWMPVPWSDDADIVGQVIWTARTLI